MNIKGRGSRRKEKAPELLEFKDLQTSFYYIRGAGENLEDKATVDGFGSAAARKFRQR